jgi:dTDP-4-amino-4,6-dideoxygalactose transaminase
MIQVNEVLTPNKEDLFALYSTILESGKITNNGRYVKQLESDLSSNLGTSNCLAISNGTIALHLAVRALGKIGEIITTPFSCVASTSAIIWEGCTPVFCDIDKDTFCIDSDLIEAKITSNTIAILAVHVYGTSCNIEAIEAIAKKHKLKVIYDGAQAFGTKYNKSSVFNLGDISTLSLHAYKIVSSIEGGALFCKDEATKDLLFKMRYFGKNCENFEETLGTNAKMNEFNAAYGILSLKQAEEELKRRKQIADTYYTELRTINKLKFQEHPTSVEPNHSYFPIICPNENSLVELEQKALANNIILRRYFYPAINSIAYIGGNDQETPISNSYAKRTLCLPIHSKLSNEDLSKIINVMKDYFS